MTSPSCFEVVKSPVTVGNAKGSGSEALSLVVQSEPRCLERTILKQVGHLAAPPKKSAQ